MYKKMDKRKNTSNSLTNYLYTEVKSSVCQLSIFCHDFKVLTDFNVMQVNLL